MAIEHWVTLVPDTKSLEKGIAAAFDKAKKGATVEVKVDKGKAEKSGGDAGKAIDKGAKASTKNTGKDVGTKIDRGTKDTTKNTGKDVGESVDKGAKDATKNTGKDVGTKIGKDLGTEADKSGKTAGTVLGTAIGGALGSIVKDRISSVLRKVISGNVKGAAKDVSSALDGISGGLGNIQNITGSDNFVGRGLQRLRDMVDNASSSVGGLADSFSSVSAGIGAINDTTSAAMELVDTFKGARDRISDVSDLLSSLEKRAPALAAALGRIAGPLIEIAGAAGAVGWVQDHLPKGLQGREPTIDKDLGPNQGKGLSGRDWGHDFTHPWEIPQRIWRNFFDDDDKSGPIGGAGGFDPIPGVGGDGGLGLVPDSDSGSGGGFDPIPGIASGGLGSTPGIARGGRFGPIPGSASGGELERSTPIFDYNPGGGLGDAITDALSRDSREDILPDIPEISEYHMGTFGDAIREAQAWDKQIREEKREAERAKREADKAQREADRLAKAAERAEGQAKREAEREADRAQREADRARREADRQADRAQREADRQADRAAREAARGSGSSGGGGRGPRPGSVGGFSGGMGGNVAAMMALAQAASGRTEYGPASDLAGGLADCSGAISDLVEVLDTGTSSSKRLFTTVDFATDEQAAKFGFLPGYMPGALNIGVNPYPGQSGHMAATLPNGVNFESGGGTGGGAQYGGNAAGALDKQFEKHYYRPVGGASSFGGGGSANPSSMPGFYAWVVPMNGDGVAAAGGPARGGGGAGLGLGGGAGGGNSVLSQLRNIGEGGAKESFLPAGFSDPTSWPNVQSGMALLNVFGGMLGGGGQQGLIGDTRNLAPGELNPAITAGGSASLMGGAEGMMTQLTQGGVARQASDGGAGGVDNSINFNGPVDGDVSKGLAKANMARTARTRVTTGPLPL
ncbi:ATP synthase F0 subunit B [Mycobacterium sp. CSUR Q5927]|nr:ATP synthase F0 subunit B [Mycobacterium sp. CSUR Q5927]